MLMKQIVAISLLSSLLAVVGCSNTNAYHAAQPTVAATHTDASYNYFAKQTSSASTADTKGSCIALESTPACREAAIKQDNLWLQNQSQNPEFIEKYLYKQKYNIPK